MIHDMRSKALWVASLMLLVCLIAVLIGYRYSQVTFERAEIQAQLLSKENRELRDRLAKQTQSIEAVERQLRDKLSRTTVVEQGPAVHRQGELPVMNGVAMFRDPGGKDLWRKLDRRAVAHGYGPTILMLGLPPETNAKLMDLLVEKDESAWDANQAAETAGLSVDEETKARHAAENAVNDQIVALIGKTDGDLLNIQNQVGMSGPIAVRTSIALDLSLTGNPLSPDQFAAASQVYNEMKPYGSAFTDSPIQTPDPVSGLTPYYSTLLARLSQTLNPTQIAVLKDEYVEQVQLQQYRLGIASHSP
jgi:hypothetical protein